MAPHILGDEAEQTQTASAVAADLQFETLMSQPSEVTETIPRKRMTARKSITGFVSDDSWIDVPADAARMAAAAESGTGKVPSTELATMLVLMQQQMHMITELQKELKEVKQTQLTAEDVAWWSEPGSPVHEEPEAASALPLAQAAHSLPEFVMQTQAADFSFIADAAQQPVAAVITAPVERIKEIPELPKLTVPKETHERATCFALWQREVKVKLDPVCSSAGRWTKGLYEDLDEAITDYHKKDETARLGLKLKAETAEFTYLSKLALPRLLEAIPKFVKDELMASQHDIDVRRLMWKLATIFLPGGSGEKASGQDHEPRPCEQCH